MTLLDVRTDAEWRQGHIAGAVHHDVQRLADGVMPDIDKRTELLVYCRSGARAGMAVELLRRAGYINAQNIGGIDNAMQYGSLVQGDNA